MPLSDVAPHSRSVWRVFRTLPTWTTKVDGKQESAVFYDLDALSEDWLPVPAEDRVRLIRELRREVPVGHVLHGIRASRWPVDRVEMTRSGGCRTATNGPGSI